MKMKMKMKNSVLQDEDSVISDRDLDPKYLSPQDRRATLSPTGNHHLWRSKRLSGTNFLDSFASEQGSISPGNTSIVTMKERSSTFDDITSEDNNNTISHEDEDEDEDELEQESQDDLVVVSEDSHHELKSPAKQTSLPTIVIQKSSVMSSVATQEKPQRNYSKAFSATRNRLPVGTKAVVDCPFKSQSFDQLTLREREVVTVLHSPMTDWWKGKTREGNVGWFPASHVHPLDYSHISGGNKFRVVSSNPMLPQSWREFHASKYEQIMKVSAKEQERQEVIYELYYTENSFVKRMETLVHNILAQVRERKLLSTTEIQEIFSNLENILELNQYFLAIIEAKYDKDPEEIMVESIGDAFLMIVDYLKLYSIYCSKRESAFKLLDKIMESGVKRSRFRNFITSCEEKSFMRGASFKELLTLPIQRICKYPILIKSLLLCTESTHPDFPLLERALTQLEVIVSVVNDFVHQALLNEALEKFRTDFSSLSSLFWSPSRKLVHFGEIMVRKCRVEKAPEYLSYVSGSNNDVVVNSRNSSSSSSSSKGISMAKGSHSIKSSGASGRARRAFAPGFPLSLTNVKLQFILFNDLLVIARQGRSNMGLSFKHIIDVIPCDLLYVVEGDLPPILSKGNTKELMKGATCSFTQTILQSSDDEDDQNLDAKRVSDFSSVFESNSDMPVSKIFHLMNPGVSEYTLEVVQETRLGIRDHLKKIQKARGLEWMSIMNRFCCHRKNYVNNPPLISKLSTTSLKRQLTRRKSTTNMDKKNMEKNNNTISEKSKSTTRTKQPTLISKFMNILLGICSGSDHSVRTINFNICFPDSFGIPAGYDVEMPINLFEFRVTVPLYFRHESEYLYMIHVEEEFGVSYCIFKTFDQVYNLHANLLHQYSMMHKSWGNMETAFQRLPYFPIENLMVSEHLLRDRQKALQSYFDRLITFARQSLCSKLMAESSVLKSFFRTSSDLLELEQISREWVIRKCLDL